MVSDAIIWRQRGDRHHQFVSECCQTPCPVPFHPVPPHLYLTILFHPIMFPILSDAIICCQICIRRAALSLVRRHHLLLDKLLSDAIICYQWCQMPYPVPSHASLMPHYSVPYFTSFIAHSRLKFTSFYFTHTAQHLTTKLKIQI